MSVVDVFADAAGSLEEEEEDAKVDVIVNVRELDEVLMKDVGNKIAESGK